jgi:hypothetical protein
MNPKSSSMKPTITKSVPKITAHKRLRFLDSERTSVPPHFRHFKLAIVPFPPVLFRQSSKNGSRRHFYSPPLDLLPQGFGQGKDRAYQRPECCHNGQPAADFHLSVRQPCFQFEWKQDERQ